jgi:TonB family protein
MFEMAPSLLYRPHQRWQTWAAFGGAALLHLSAIAIAQSQPKTFLRPTICNLEADMEVVSMSEDEQLPPEPAEAISPLTPSILPDESLLPDENPTPPPVRKVTQKPAPPILRRVAQGLDRPWRVLAVSAPRPEYPYEARRQRLTGSGMATLTIDPMTGRVTDVWMSRSTGSVGLDDATTSAFRRWRFRPGSVSKVETPITYTLRGAAY